MLIDQKVVFEQNLKQNIYDALKPSAKDAFKKTSVTTSGDADIDNMIQQAINEVSENFAETLAVNFSNKVAPKLADTIYNYIKSIGVQITVPVPGTTVLSSPVGPVTGVINILPNNVQII